MIANGGNLVMTGAEQEAIGIRVFDVISTSADFAEAYPSVVTAFLQVTEDANRAYNDNREPFIDTIAGAVGMDRESTSRCWTRSRSPRRTCSCPRRGWAEPCNRS